MFVEIVLYFFASRHFIFNLNNADDSIFNIMTYQTGPNFLDLEGEDEPLRQVEQEEEDGDLTSGLRINHVRRQSLKTVK